MQKLFKIFLASVLCSSVLARESVADNFLGIGTPWTPRITFNLQGGDPTSFGEGDALVPLWALEDRLFFLDARGLGSVHEVQEYSVGLGYRQLTRSDELILGGYSFFDFVVSGNNNLYHQVNVGVEALSGTWDFRANGYIPVGQKEFDYFLGGTGTFTGHTLVLNKYYVTEQAIHPGFDVEVGRSLPGLRDLRVYGSYYHYGFNDNTNINGGRLRAEYKINHTITLTAADQYDNQNRNQFLLGLRVNFGGVSTETYGSGVADRMEDFIIRNPFSGTQTTLTETPKQVTAQDNGQGLVLDSDGNLVLDSGNQDPTTPARLYYFVNSQAAPGGNGTYEAPYQTEQEAITAAGAGNYIIYTYQGTYGLGGQFSLYPGQQLFGANAPLVIDGVGTIPQGTASTVLNGQIVMANNTGLNNLTVDGTGVAVSAGRSNKLGAAPAGVGVYGDSLSNLAFNNITVQNFSGATPVGMQLTNNQGVVLSGVTVQGITGSGSSSTGIQLLGNTVPTGSTSQLLLNNISVWNVTGNNAIGVQLAGNNAPITLSSVAVNNVSGNNAMGMALITNNVPVTLSSVSMQNVSGTTGMLFNGNGPVTYTQGTLTAITGIGIQFISNASFSLNNVAVSGVIGQVGIQANATGATSSNVTFNGVTVSNVSGSGSTTTGIDLTNATNVTISNSTVSGITGSSADGTAYSGTSSLNAGTAGSAMGINLQNTVGVSVNNTQITGIAGGSANGASEIQTGAVLYVGSGGTGGEAIGINVSGSYSDTINNVTIESITGGSANAPTNLANGADVVPANSSSSGPGGGGTGGNAIAVNVGSSSNLTVNTAASAIVGGSANGAVLGSGLSLGAPGLTWATAGGGKGGSAIGVLYTACSSCSFAGSSLSNSSGGSASAGLTNGGTGILGAGGSAGQANAGTAGGVHNFLQQ